MSLKNTSLLNAVDAMVKAAQPRTPLQKSIAAMRDHFGLDGGDSISTADRIKAGKARSKNTELRAPAAEEDAAPREADAQAPAIGYGPEWSPMAWRVDMQRQRELLDGVGAAYREQADRELDLALSAVRDPGNDSQTNMRTAKLRQPRSRTSR